MRNITSRIIAVKKSADLNRNDSLTGISNVWNRYIRQKITVVSNPNAAPRIPCAINRTVGFIQAPLRLLSIPTICLYPASVSGVEIQFDFNSWSSFWIIRTWVSDIKYCLCMFPPQSFSGQQCENNLLCASCWQERVS